MRNTVTRSSTVAIRNALRPFFNNRKKLPYWKQFQTIRQTIGASEIGALFHLTEDNPSYSFGGFGNAFPLDPKTIPDIALRRLTPLSLERELRLQIGRINYHAERLREAVKSLADINNEISQVRWEAAHARIEVHARTFGWSLLLLKKEFLVALAQGGLSSLSLDYKKLIEGRQGYAWSLLCHWIYDLADPTYNPIRSTALWSGISMERLQEQGWYAQIIQYESMGYATDADTLPSALLRYNGLSLLDLVFLMWRSTNSNDPWPDAQRAWHRIDEELRRTIEGSFQELLIPVPEPYMSPTGVSDASIFRLSFFFQEYRNIHLWRLDLATLLFDKQIKPPAPTREWITPLAASEKVVADPTSLNDVLMSMTPWLTSILRNPPETVEQTFIGSAVVGVALSEIAETESFEPHVIIDLLSSPKDLAAFLNEATCNTLINHPCTASSEVLIFLLCDLKFRRKRNHDNELTRRTAFMKIFAKQPDLTILALLDDLWRWTPATALRVAKLCTRSFLERLFLLMSSVKDVIETRLAICTWLRARGPIEDEAFKEEEDALRRELSNLDARSDLDSTRIHVDEDSLREWFNETQREKALRYLQTVLAEGPTSTYPTFLGLLSSRLKEREQKKGDEFSHDADVGSEFILLQIVEFTLNAFAKDRTFGLDSYLSRRIRHGTLSGTVMTPINRTIRKIEESLVEDDDGLAIRTMLQTWRNELSVEIDHARRNVIQIRSPSNPDGLIQATWTHQANVRHLDAMIARVRTRALESDGYYDIFPDIYALCWDCLEADLAQLRYYMTRMFYPKVVEQLRTGLSTLTLQQTRIVYSYIDELHRTLLGRVHEICGWFIRPVFRRDLYNLQVLVSSTLSVVRDLDDRYEFVENVSVNPEISVDRGSFEFIGDALFVLIGNAAKHGLENGNVWVNADYFDTDKMNISITVTSEVADKEAFDTAVARIKSAFSALGNHALEVAAVGEGFSGLRKVAGLLSRTRSPNVQLFFRSDSENMTICFEVRLPSEKSFGREAQ